MLTRLTLLKSAIIGAMTSIGYPDYLKPRDYLAGLASSQVAGSGAIGSGLVDVYTIPAGKTLVIRVLAVSIGVVANGVGTYSMHAQQITLQKGFDGASAPVTIGNIAVVCTPTGSANGQESIEVEVEAQGGAAGNKIQANGTLTNAGTWVGSCQVYGALIG